MKHAPRESDSEDESVRVRGDAVRESDRSTADTDRVASLHRSVGNQAVQTLVENDGSIEAPSSRPDGNDGETGSHRAESRQGPPAVTPDEFSRSMPGFRIRTDAVARSFLERENAVAAARGTEVRIRSESLEAPGGRRLLAHEYAHVLQQRSEELPKASTGRQETDAEAFADDVLAGRRASVSVGASRGWAFQSDVATEKRVNEVQIRQDEETVIMVTNDGTRYVYRLGDNTIPKGVYTATGVGSDLRFDPSARTNFETSPSFTFGRDSTISTSETVPHTQVRFASTVKVSVKGQSTTSKTSTPPTAGTVAGESSSHGTPGGGPGPTEPTTETQKSESEPTERTDEAATKTGSGKEPAPEYESVVEPTKLELPRWIPPAVRTAIKTDDYSEIGGESPRKGVFRVSTSKNGPFGDVIIWTEDIGSGYRKIQVFQMFPDDRGFYRNRGFTDGSDYQTRLFHSVFTDYNKDLWKYVKAGMSISRARAQIREDATKEAKRAFIRAMTLFEAAHGGLELLEAGGRAVRDVVAGRAAKSSGSGGTGSKTAADGGTGTKKTTDKPTGKTTDKPTGKTTDKPTGKTTDKPTGKTTDKPTGKTAKGGEGAARGFDSVEFVHFPIGKQRQQELIEYWQRRIRSTDDAGKKETYRGYIENIENGDRPHWRQSEEEVGYFYGKVGKGKREVSFKHGRSANRGEEASTRVDVVDENALVEVKRVKPDNKSSLHNKLKVQLVERATQGPKARVNQTVVLDVRGLDLSPKRLQEVTDEIVSDVNEALSAHEMKNLKKLNPSDIQIVTW